MTRRIGGHPGERIPGCPVRVIIHPQACPSDTSTLEVLRRPVEFTQYTSIRFSERLAEAGIQPSVGAVGSSYDNALAESINGLYKTELIRPRRP